MKTKKVVTIIMLFIVECICLTLIIQDKYKDYKEDHVFKEMEQSYFDSTDIKNKKNTQTENKSSFKIKQMKNKSKNVIGWIYCKDVLSYPIVKGKDNSFYLSHNPYDQINTSGSIFMDCRLKNNFNSTNCIIYGHNMKNKYMFGSLLNYIDKDFSKKNNIFYIDDGKKKYKYTLYSVRIVKDNYEDYDINLSGKMYKKWLTEIGNTQYYKDTERYSNYSITLSTCYSSDATKKLVLHLVRA